MIRRIFYIVFALLVAVAGLAFHARNNQPISLDFFAAQIRVDLSWVVVATLSLGAVLGIFAMSAKVVALKARVRRLEQAREQASRELTSLRAVALKDAG